MVWNIWSIRFIEIQAIGIEAKIKILIAYGLMCTNARPKRSYTYTCRITYVEW